MTATHLPFCPQKCRNLDDNTFRMPKNWRCVVAATHLSFCPQKCRNLDDNTFRMPKNWRRVMTVTRLSFCPQKCRSLDDNTFRMPKNWRRVMTVTRLSFYPQKCRNLDTPHRTSTVSSHQIACAGLTPFSVPFFKALPTNCDAKLRHRAIRCVCARFRDTNAACI